MNVIDVITGLFEFCGSIFLWRNVYQLHKDKMVRGVHWVPTGFFFLWGMWNIFFYPSLNLWFSFVGGLNIMCANGVWLGQMIYYRKN
jgi:hypothetical protein